MDETIDSLSTDEVVSSVSDLHEAPLRALIHDPAPQVDKVIDRVLDLEANGLLTVASFNASI
jgi:hypothetical protein